MENQFARVETLTYLLQQDTSIIMQDGLNYLMKSLKTILPLGYVGKLSHGISHS